MPKLLVIDDEPNIAFTIRETLSSPTLTVLSAETATAGIELVRREKPDVVLLDVRLPDMSGLDAFSQIHQIDPRLPVIIMTAFAKTETAIEAMRRGAFEYFVKPVDLGRLRKQVTQAIEMGRLSRVPAVVAPDEAEELDADVIVGNSPAMHEVYKTIGRVAPQDATVLILGESGTGKELVARAIYHYSQRQEKPFLAVNCAALSETLLESELFGHERGAFTGADQRRIGKFEQVHGGTIFLDEIGDMSPATQAKALRLLQQQQFERVGGNQTIHTDVRIIAATNRDLETMVAEGAFRQDLFYRLNGFVIALPPLRTRVEDIPLLTSHFIRRANRELGKHVRTVTPEFEKALAAHNWPGNIRELQSAVRFAMVQATGDVLTADYLPESCRRASSLGAGGTRGTTAAAAPGLDVEALTRRLLTEGPGDVYRQVISAVEKVLVEEAMRATGNNQQRAAELLGLSRMTLRAKLRAFEPGLERTDDGEAGH